MASPIYIAGTGSFAAEIASWAADSGAEISGLIEPQQPERVGSTIHGLPVVALGAPQPGAAAVLGFSGNRRANWELLAENGWSAAGLVHPTAHIAASAQLAASATVGPCTVIGAEAVIGEGVILSRGVLLGHHVLVGEYATLNPGVNIGGSSEIGAGAFLGMGCVIVNNVTVGEQATVAAGAVTLREVPAGARVQGIPAVSYGSA